MKNKNLGLRVAAVIFAVIAVGHLLRMLFGIEVTAGSLRVSHQVSAWVFVGFGALGGWLWWLARRA